MWIILQRVRLDKDWIVPTRWSWITEPWLVGQGLSWVCMMKQIYKYLNLPKFHFFVKHGKMRSSDKNPSLAIHRELQKVLRTHSNERPNVCISVMIWSIENKKVNQLWVNLCIISPRFLVDSVVTIIYSWNQHTATYWAIERWTLLNHSSVNSLKVWWEACGLVLRAGNATLNIKSKRNCHNALNFYVIFFSLCLV